MKKIMLSLAMALVSVCASAQVYIGGTAGISSNKIGDGDSKTACAPFFYLQANTLLLFTLHLFFGNPCVYRHSEG